MRSVCDVRHAEDARQLHHQRRARSVVVRGLAPAVSVHVRADDVHLVGPGGPDLGAVDLLARSRCGRLAIELAQLFIRLRVGIVVDAGPPRDPAIARAARSGSHFTAGNDRIRRFLPAALPPPPPPFGRRRRVVLILQPLGRAAVALELRLDPVDGLAIALVPWRRSPNCVRPLMVALYFSRSRRPTSVRIGSVAWGPVPPAAARRRVVAARRDRKKSAVIA